MKYFLGIALVGGLLPFAASALAADTMYAYCSGRDDATHQKYTTKVFTVTTDALMVGYEVPTMAVNVASYTASDLKGQFFSLLEAEGIDNGFSSCYAAGTMEDLSAHYDQGKAYGPSDKSRFGTWNPEGDFVISSELWRD